MRFLILFLVLFLTTNLYAETYVIAVLNKGECPQSRSIETFLQDKELVQQALTMHHNIKIIYGSEDKGYVKLHKIKWFPTILRFKVNDNGTWTEQERIVGAQTKDYWWGFFGKPKIESLPIPKQTIQLPVYKIAPSKGKT